MARMEKNGRTKARAIDGPFVPLLASTIDSPAWRAMSHGARSLYVALRRRMTNDAGNNGRIFVSQRLACEELGSSKEQIVRWFRELQHYGFIVMTAAGSLGIEGRGKAPHWRLTECGCNRPKGESDPPTRDFQRWDGTKFQAPSRKTKKQNPGPESRSGVDRKAGTPSDRKAGTPKVQSGPESRSIQRPTGVPESRSISSSPSTQQKKSRPRPSPRAGQRVPCRRGGRREGQQQPAGLEKRRGGRESHPGGIRQQRPAAPTGESPGG